MNSELQSFAAAIPTSERLTRSSGSSGSGNVVSYRLPRDTTTTTTASVVYHFRYTTSGELNKMPGPPWFQTMLGPGSGAEREAALEAGCRER